MERRQLIKTLFVAPLATLIPQAKISKELFLPIGADLSFTSLSYACRIGAKGGFGRPLCLIVGPENIFPARELLGPPMKPYTADSEINVLWEYFGYRVDSRLPYNEWYLQFEDGIVKSRGPY